MSPDFVVKSVSDAVKYIYLNASCIEDKRKQLEGFTLHFYNGNGSNSYEIKYDYVEYGEANMNNP